jgi:hypothetical protein
MKEMRTRAAKQPNANLTLIIISGGQTGVDRAALDWALANGVPHGGWCPKGRKAEDGIIPARFKLKETPSETYSVRTRRNVRESEGTVIFSRNPELRGGTRETAECAKRLGKPLLHLVVAEIEHAASRLKAFLREHEITVLNVAGPRETEEPGLSEFVRAVLARALKD